MKNYREIVNEIKATTDEIKTLENEIEKRITKNGTDEIEKTKADRAYDLHILRTILYDNMRRAYATEKLPILIDILKKYDGKKYGEKTKDKINAEMKEKAGCAVYMAQKYTKTDVTLIPLKNGYTDYSIYNYNDYQFIAEILTSENKITVPSTIDDFTIICCKPYDADPEGTVEQIKKLFAEAEQLRAAAEKKAREYNSLINNRLNRFDISKSYNRIVNN